MREVIITFKLLCNWRGETGPVYRLYLNKELVTERTYIWDNSMEVIQERIPAYLEPGPHNLYVENLNPELGTILIDNFRINGQPRTLRESDSRFVINIDDVIT